jgi:hypothetical protein
MLNHLKRNLQLTVVLLVLLPATSALGAYGVGRPGAHVVQRGVRHGRPSRKPGHKPGAVVHRAGRRTVANATGVLLGDVAVEWQYDFLPAGQAEAFRLRAGASGLASAVHMFVSGNSTAGKLIVGLYASAGSHAGELLSSGSTATLEPGGWNTVSIAPVELVSGRSYWLAILGEAGKLRYHDRASGPCPSETSASRNLRALPSSWGTGRIYSDCPVSAYVTAAPLAPSPAGARLVSTLTEQPALVEQLAASASSPVPVATAPPVISGETAAGQILRASTGSWTGSPSSYEYRWQDCNTSGEDCSNVGEATSSSYTLASSDVGHTIRVVVRAGNAGGWSAPSTSAPTEVVEAQPPPGTPANTAPPTIEGTAEEGQMLSANAGTWTESPTSFKYQWKDCSSSGEACTNIGKATSSTYTIASRNVGHTIRVVVTASNAVGSAKAASETTEVVAAEATPAVPASVSPPEIEGSAEEGQTLSASTGTWTESPTSFEYQWEDCDEAGEACSEISKARSSSYKLLSSDVGHTIRVLVTASNAVGPSAPASSPVTEVVEAQSTGAPTNRSLPTIHGSAEEGQTLSASTGTWTGDPTSYEYEWEDCDESGGSCSEISKAHSSSYKLLSSDVGHTIRVVVTAKNASGSASATSTPSGEVQAAGSFRTFYIAYASGSESNDGTSEATPWKRAPGMQGCVEQCAAYKAKPGDHFIFKGGEEWPHSVFPFVVEHWGEAGREDYYGVKESWYAGGSYTAPTFNANHELITNPGPIGSPYKLDTMLWLRGVSYTTIEGIAMENWTAVGIKQAEPNWYCDAIDIWDTSPGGEQLHLNRLRFTKWSSDFESEQNSCFDKVIRSNSSYLDNVSLTNSTIEGEQGKALGWEVGCVGTVENDVIGDSTALVEPCPNSSGVGIVAHNRLFNCGYPKWPAGIRLAGGMHADAMQSENEPVADQSDYIYDNVVAGTGNAGEGILGEESGNPNENGEYEGECEAGLLGGEAGSHTITTYMWDNVLYNILGNPPQIDGHTKDWYSWDNSMEGGHHGTSSCLGIAQRNGSHGSSEPEDFVWKNNLCVTSEPDEEGAVSSVREQSAASHMNNNLVVEPSSLAAARYTSVKEVEESGASYVFAPLNSGASGVGKGEDLASLCSGELTSLCEDTTYGQARNPVQRPQSGAWDVGAYQW